MNSTWPNRWSGAKLQPLELDRRGRPIQFARRSAAGPYVLATGEAAAYRLRILHDLYGPGTRRVLLESGLRRGMRVADLGCGVGMVTALLAELVGPEGTSSASTPAAPSSPRPANG